MTMARGFQYRDPNPAATALARMKISRKTAAEIELEAWLALDAVRRGGAPNSLANKVTEYVGIAQVLWAAHADKAKYDTARLAWSLLCQCSMADEAAPLALTADAYDAVRRTMRTILANLTKFTMGELKYAVEEVRRMTSGT